MADLGLGLSALGAGAMQGYNADIARQAQAAQLAQENHFKQGAVTDAQNKEIDGTLATIPDYDTAQAYAQAHGRPMGSALPPPPGSNLPPLNPYFKGDLTGLNAGNRNVYTANYDTTKGNLAQDRIAANNFKTLMTQAGTPDAQQQALAKSLDANTGSRLYDTLWGANAQPDTTPQSQPTGPSPGIPPATPSLPTYNATQSPNGSPTGGTNFSGPVPGTPPNVPPAQPVTSQLAQAGPAPQGAPGPTVPANVPRPTPGMPTVPVAPNGAPVPQNVASAPTGSPPSVPPAEPTVPQAAPFQGFGLTPKAQAQVDNLTARSGLATAQTKQIDTLLQPRLLKIGADIRLDDANTDWKTKLLDPTIAKAAADTARDMAETKAIPERLAIAWANQKDNLLLAKSLITYRQGELLNGGTNALANIDRALAALNTSYNTGTKDQNAIDPNSPMNALKQINYDLDNAGKTSRALTMAGAAATDPRVVAAQKTIADLTAKKQAIVGSSSYPTPSGLPPSPSFNRALPPASPGLMPVGPNPYAAQVHASQVQPLTPVRGANIPPPTPTPLPGRQTPRSVQGKPVVGHTMRPVAPQSGLAPTNANGNQDLGEGHTYDPRTAKVYYNGVWTGKYMHRINR